MNVFGDLNSFAEAIRSQIDDLEVISKNKNLFLEELQKMVWLIKKRGCLNVFFHMRIL